MTKRIPLFVNKDPFYSNCPSCGKTGALRGSNTRGVWERFFKKFLFLGFYRCRECGWRGKRFSKKNKAFL